MHYEKLLLAALFSGFQPCNCLVFWLVRFAILPLNLEFFCFLFWHAREARDVEWKVEIVFGHSQAHFSPSLSCLFFRPKNVPERECLTFFPGLSAILRALVKVAFLWYFLVCRSSHVTVGEEIGKIPRLFFCTRKGLFRGFSRIAMTSNCTI